MCCDVHCDVCCDACCDMCCDIGWTGVVICAMVRFILEVVWEEHWGVG